MTRDSGTPASPGDRDRSASASRRSAAATNAAAACLPRSHPAPRWWPTCTASAGQLGPRPPGPRPLPDRRAVRRCPRSHGSPSRVSDPTMLRCRAATSRPPGHERSPHAQPDSAAQPGAAAATDAPRRTGPDTSAACWSADQAAAPSASPPARTATAPRPRRSPRVSTSRNSCAPRRPPQNQGSVALTPREHPAIRALDALRTERAVKRTSPSSRARVPLWRRPRRPQRSGP